MARLTNHYEAAFEAWLIDHDLPYLAVDERRRNQLEDVSLKSMDFLVPLECGQTLVIDVKGRRSPKTAKAKRWENWCPEDDIRSLKHWESIFGPGYQAMLVFAYELQNSPENLCRSPHSASSLLRFSDQDYLFEAITIASYQQAMRRRSVSWKTVHLLAADSAELLQPLAPMIEALNSNACCFEEI